MTAIIRRNPNRMLTLVEPFYRPSRLIEEVEALAREIFDSRRPLAFSTGLLPNLDIYQEKDELVVRAELPGVKEKDFDISLEDDVLTIKAEKKEEEVAEEATYYACERHFGRFSRSVSLPFHVDADKSSAIFKDGLLEIRLPKAEEAKGRHIEVKVQ